MDFEKEINSLSEIFLLRLVDPDEEPRIEICGSFHRPTTEAEANSIGGQLNDPRYSAFAEHYRD